MTQLDDKGRCCGRKPMVYKRGYGITPGPYQFCPRCDRAFNMQGAQIANWAFEETPDGFQPTQRWKRKP